MFLRMLITMNAVKESSPLVGSSRMITDAFEISSTPIDVLLRSPPLTPLRILFPMNVC